MNPYLLNKNKKKTLILEWKKNIGTINRDGVHLLRDRIELVHFDVKPSVGVQMLLKEL